ncbi:MAG: glycoside hydrolase [Candidatus Binatia bacterium]|nr:MAG: glycoside hydrolase [Candidatus Binatia bacterium]
MSPSKRYVCIHGHFYQPPRENPWLEVIDRQESAAPYHDWNERVTAECYEPNAAARVLDRKGRILKLRNNYAAISFNFGPTLLAWLQRTHPELYGRIIDSDRESQRRYGAGSAIAQVYGHAILPLASPRDQITQVRWGIQDFSFRFGRPPEGMWLPETAVDEASLRVLAEHGIRFTILAPHQARRVSYGGGAWHDTHGEGIDPTRPYLCDLGQGRSIVVFFYDGPIARGIAFEGWLQDGRALAARIVSRAEGMQENGILHVAADGETYGHHHRFGEMALAAALEALENDPRIRLINYGAYLRAVEVRDRVEIRPFTSWSCAHGVERWRSGCSCHAGHPSWDHAWREPLREALDWLKAKLDVLFEQEAEKWLTDPWEARDAYVSILLARTGDQRDRFLQAHARRELDPSRRVQVWKLLEMQRHALLMFTSCGWFFDDPSGLETTQVLTYAARAMQLAEAFGQALCEPFLLRLKPMRSNLLQYKDGAEIFERLVRPRMSTPIRVVADYALNALLDPPPLVHRRYVYEFASLERVFDVGGTPSFVAGRVELHDELTEEKSTVDYGAVHLGGHDFFCVADMAEPRRDTAWRQHLLATFRTRTLMDVLAELQKGFPNGHFTLGDMFVDERQQILERVTGEMLERARAFYRRIVTDNRRLIEFLVHHGLEIPEELRMAMRLVVQRSWVERAQEFVEGRASLDELAAVGDDAARWGIELEKEATAQAFGRALAEAVACIWRGPAQDCYERARALLEASGRLNVPVDLRCAQNLFYTFWQEKSDKSLPIPGHAIEELGHALGFAVGGDDETDAS